MINIVCVKIGSKYGSIYANKLHGMCSAFVSQPFKFFCYTDDPVGLHPEIKVIPYVDFDLHPIVFNKLFLLSDEFALKINNNPTFFFDLDIVIKKNIDGFINRSKETSTFKTINAVWKSLRRKDIEPPYLDHTINSSCMFWIPGTTNHLWSSFIENKQAFLKKYWRGMDGFLFYEHKIRGGLPEDCFYSFLYDIDRKVKRIMSSPEEYEVYKDSVPIVLFNGPTTQEDIDDFVSNGYKSYYSRFEEAFNGTTEQREDIRKEIGRDMLLRQL
jgi:hypothetical protein